MHTRTLRTVRLWLVAGLVLASLILLPVTISLTSGEPTAEVVAFDPTQSGSEFDPSGFDLPDQGWEPTTNGFVWGG
jgi:hypothetical protein